MGTLEECGAPHANQVNDCKHCRGRRSRCEHKMSCLYGKHGSDCDCFVTWEEAPFRRAVAPIGLEFVDHTGHVFRVTDVGTRTLIVIDITEALANGYTREELTGPPYSVHEQVWSEYDVESPWNPEGLRWEEQMLDPCTALFYHSFEYHEGKGPCAHCGKVSVSTSEAKQ